VLFNEASIAVRVQTANYVIEALMRRSVSGVPARLGDAPAVRTSPAGVLQREVLATLRRQALPGNRPKRRYEAVIVRVVRTSVGGKQRCDEE